MASYIAQTNPPQTDSRLSANNALADSKADQRRRRQRERKAYIRQQNAIAQDQAALGLPIEVRLRRRPAKPRPAKPPWYLTLNKEHVEPYKPT
jgi:hypothetical protein